MADLSAVLRKTIDGLPRANPQMRAKVYEKARAAIARQIDAANPPLADEVVEARRTALEDAIARTEDHYAARDAEEAAGTPAPQEAAPPPRAEPRPAPPVRAPAPAPDDRPAATRRDPQPAPDGGPPARDVPPAPRRAAPPSAGDPTRARAAPSLPAPAAPVPSAERTRPPVVPVGIEPRDGPETVDAPFALGGADTRDRRSASRLVPPRIASTEPATGLDEGAIPAADVTAPRQGNGARRARARSRTPIYAGLAVLLFAGAATGAYVYLDDIRAALNIGGANVAATATPDAATSAADTPSADTPSADTTEEPGTDVAAVPEAGTAQTTTPSTPSAPPAGGDKRRFTQRLLPDGTEVDEGPGLSIANAFEEGTNIAAASPPSPAPPPPPAAAQQAPQTAPVPPAAPAQAPAQPPAEPPAPATGTAAVPPATGSASTPAVAQKAVFYEERSETDAGTQRGGNVVWSVVQEAPAEGQPPEAAIRAVADVPEENLKMTLTIRRNTDATLPASHVIELMFDTPPDFPGGSIANVQRLALKPTEQARGEPLIGVAGKISDGFFIIALNNLSEATNTNLDLLNKEQWIDIPIAYATGRRALMSIEKGIPGDRAFKQAMDAWAGKT